MYPVQNCDAGPSPTGTTAGDRHRAVQVEMAPNTTEPEPEPPEPPGAQGRPLPEPTREAAPGLDLIFAGARLSPREKDVFERKAGGWRNREIGLALSISPKTVEALQRRYRAKLGIGGQNAEMRLLWRARLQAARDRTAAGHRRPWAVRQEPRA